MNLADGQREDYQLNLELQTGIKLSSKQVSRILQKKSRRVTRLDIKSRRQRAASLYLAKV